MGEDDGLEEDEDTSCNVDDREKAYKEVELLPKYG